MMVTPLKSCFGLADVDATLAALLAGRAHERGDLVFPLTSPGSYMPCLAPFCNFYRATV